LNLAQAAHAYAHHGRRVFPLNEGGKRPTTPAGVNDATNDPAVVTAWWARRPKANIGLAVLPHEVIVDVDVRSGGHDTLSAWTDEFGALPHTPCQVTPTNGVHYVFARPAGVELVAHPGAGIDVLGAGKYIVAAPSSITPADCRRDMAIAMKLGKAGDFWKFAQAFQSLDESGRTTYDWTTRLSRTRLASAPAWLAKLIFREPSSTPGPLPVRMPAHVDVVTRAQKWLEKADPAIQGQGGSNTCFRVTSRLVRGFILDEETALALLETVYNPRCSPPWSRRELKHKIKQAVARGNCAWGALLEQRRSA
jgi:hypothetical protein